METASATNTASSIRRFAMENRWSSRTPGFRKASLGKSANRTILSLSAFTEIQRLTAIRSREKWDGELQMLTVSAQFPMMFLSSVTIMRLLTPYVSGMQNPVKRHSRARQTSTVISNSSVTSLMASIRMIPQKRENSSVSANSTS